MRYFQTSVLAIALLLSFCVSAIAAKPSPANKGFVVVELFTSEGCSSCPPADELVAKVQKQYQDQPVYILAFHVDYWNRLGWKDAFSSADYSQRQEAYAKLLHIPSVYTPQIVINGQREFVGSQEGSLRNAIVSSLAKQSSAQINLITIKNTGSGIHVNYGLSGATKYSEVVLALVQKSAQTQVKAGENSGHTLQHVQIVRQVQRVSAGLNTNGSGVLSLPRGANPQNFEVIALLQDTATGEITAAARQTLHTAI